MTSSRGGKMERESIDIVVAYQRLSLEEIDDGER